MKVNRRSLKRDAIIEFCTYGRTAAEIGKHIGIKARSAFHLLNKLIAAGLIQKIGKGRRDGPIIYVAIVDEPEPPASQPPPVYDIPNPNFYNDPFNLTGIRQ